jgi:hypothetical protein
MLTGGDKGSSLNIFPVLFFFRSESLFWTMVLKYVKAPFLELWVITFLTPWFLICGWFHYKPRSQVDEKIFKEFLTILLCVE